MLDKIIDTRKKVIEKKPLVHHITNYVTVNDCANVTLALGGSPVMADDAREVEEMVSISNALVLNIGTLQENQIHSMIIAGKKANDLNIPVIFDPVGVSTTTFRKKAVKEILNNIKADIIKGNISEIGYLANFNISSKGVDACNDKRINPIEIAKTAAKKYKCIIGITGEIDVISNGEKCVRILNGRAEMERVTGTGCMISSLIGTCCGAVTDYFIGAVTGISAMSLAGDLASEALKGGTSNYRNAIIDKISQFDENILKNKLKIKVE